MLESRVPFLDVKVFDYAKKLPIDFRCNDEATKRAFRIAAKRHIPEATANKKKLGFPVPIRVWLKEDNYYNKVMETLTGEAAQKFFNTDILVKLMEDHRAGKLITAEESGLFMYSLYGIRFILKMKTLDQLIRIGLIIELELHSRFYGGLKQYYKVKKFV